MCKRNTENSLETLLRLLDKLMLSGLQQIYVEQDFIYCPLYTIVTPFSKLSQIDYKGTIAQATHCCCGLFFNKVFLKTFFFKRQTTPVRAKS